MLVQWQKDFEWGHPTTDAAHREVVDLLNELDVLSTAGEPPDTIGRALDALVHLLSTHLQTHDDAAPMIGQARDLHRVWQESAAPPAHSDLRLLAHWWLRHLCRQHRSH